MGTKRLPGFQVRKIAEEIAAGATPSQAAESAGLPRSTGLRLAKRPEFQAMVHDFRSALAKEVAGQLLGKATAAIETLSQIASDPNAREACRVSAAQSLIRLLPIVAEHSELRHRISELEKRIESEKVA